MRKIICGDCAEALKKLDDNSVDAVVTDPPYGLGNHEPTVAEIIAFLQGGSLNTGGDFMGKDWDIPSIKVWTEIFRVLKPGGHVLSFGGTRSWDLISLGLRAAGFENRDTIASDFPGLRWAYGSGFPKNHDVSKAIDKMLGAEREVVGKRTDGRYKYGFSDEAKQAQGGVASEYSNGWVGDPTEVTASATAEAEQWDGWGTALKPSWEPILVFRKPFQGTVVENVLKHGTGGMNIDGCRVAHVTVNGGSLDKNPHLRAEIRIGPNIAPSSIKMGQKKDLVGIPHPQGRWPPNTVLTHHPDCKRVGEKKVKPSNGSGTAKRKRGVTTGGLYEGGFQSDIALLNLGYVDEDGIETIESWECAPGCPVKALDEQSGTTTNTRHMSYERAGEGFIGSIADAPENRWWVQETGTASRFFPSFPGQEPVEVPFKYVAKPNKRETSLEGQIENKHPTKKPLELMRWLVRLVCPKGGTVLDPYCGSATTLHAARLEGMNYVGIERDEGFYDIAKARMDIIDQETADVEHGRNIFDMLLEMDDDD